MSKPGKRNVPLRCQARKPDLRRGFTMVEALLSITIGAIVFAAAVEMLGVASHADSVGTESAAGIQALDRLAEQFRDDVRRAVEIRPGKTAENWSVQLPDSRRVDYSVDGRLLRRTVYQSDKVVSRDAFVLGDKPLVNLALGPAQRLRNVVLSMRHGDAPADEMEISAPIGWDRRFANPAKDDKVK